MGDGITRNTNSWLSGYCVASSLLLDQLNLEHEITRNSLRAAWVEGAEVEGSHKFHYY
jgi:hypothetical protein